MAALAGNELPRGQGDHAAAREAQPAGAGFDLFEELARDADVFICEATLVEPEDDPHGHMTADEARQVFRASGARRLLLTHRAVELPLDELVYDGFELELDP